MHTRRISSHLLLAASLTLSGVAWAKKNPPPPAIESGETTPWTNKSPETKALLAALNTAGGKFTPEVKAAALAEARAAARRELTQAGITLPADFLVWVDSDPVRAASIYACRPSPARALAILRSLELDLGTETVRGRAANLALATALTYARSAPLSELAKPVADQPEALQKLGFSTTARPPLALAIPPCPLRRVNTHPTDRPLDLNDHIVNFFEGRTIEVEKRTGTRMENGKKVPILEKQTIPLAACHVMASAALQREFNDYLKARGQTVSIDCGEGVITPDRHDAFDRKSPEAQKILEAFRLFKTAYEEKGLLPARRDELATPAEWMAYLLRNDGARLAPGVTASWPRFPIDAPWPVLILLIQARQPLREADDLWRRWHDRGEFHGYGEYIGGIAQQYDFQSARRLAPFDFGYGSIQMMFKDGGVCGTMAAIAARNHAALGTPSVTAGQPGHCALILQSHDPKTGLFELKGAQFVTGGPDKTTPHADWVLDDTAHRRAMPHHQAITRAVNRDINAFTDGLMARAIALRLPEPERRLFSDTLLGDALVQNPWNILALESAVNTASEPETLIGLRSTLHTRIKTLARAGSPDDPIYRATADRLILARLEKLPAPERADSLSAVLDFLADTPVPDGPAWLKYQKLHKTSADLRTDFEKTFVAHIAGARTPESCDKMASRLRAAADTFAKKAERAAWAAALYSHLAGHETYTSAGARKKSKPLTDPAAELLCKLAGKSAEALALESARARALAEAAGRDLSDQGK